MPITAHATLYLAAIGLAFGLIGGQAFPARAVTPADEPAVEPADEPTDGAEPAIDGFRTARFGMDESAVRRAIFADFGRAGAAVGRQRNDLEQTTVLALQVDELVPGSGPAAISYVLGQGGSLIQVTILWGLTEDPSVTAADLNATAGLLIAYFTGQGHVSVSGEEPVVFVDGSNLLFYARDPEGSGLALSALPRRDPAAPAGAPPFLRLAYSTDLDNPDVFRTPAITP